MRKIYPTNSVKAFKKLTGTSELTRYKQSINTNNLSLFEVEYSQFAMLLICINTAHGAVFRESIAFFYHPEIRWRMKQEN